MWHVIPWRKRLKNARGEAKTAVDALCARGSFSTFSRWRKGTILLTGVSRSHPGFGTADDAHFFPCGDKWHVPTLPPSRLTIPRPLSAVSSRVVSESDGRAVDKERESPARGLSRGCFRGEESRVGKTLALIDTHSPLPPFLFPRVLSSSFRSHSLSIISHHTT